MSAAAIFERLAQTVDARKGADPASSYVASLMHRGHDAILKKLAEEAAELLLAAKDGDKAQLVHETADLWFHSLIVLAWHGVNVQDVFAELARREGVSGLAEKASRQ